MLAKMGKVALGALSVTPLVFFAAFFFWLIPAFFAPRPDDAEKSLFAQRFELLEPFAIGSSVLLVLLTILYAVILARKSSVSVAEKIGIPVAILATSGLLLPVVFWLYVWRGSSLGSLSKKAAV